MKATHFANLFLCFGALLLVNCGGSSGSLFGNSGSSLGSCTASMTGTDGAKHSVACTEYIWTGSGEPTQQVLDVSEDSCASNEMGVFSPGPCDASNSAGTCIIDFTDFLGANSEYEGPEFEVLNNVQFGLVGYGPLFTAESFNQLCDSIKAP